MIDNHVAVLFPQATGTSKVLSWSVIVADVLISLYGMAWLLTQFGRVGVEPYQVAAALLVGLFLADWFSGLVHWSYDTWMDENTYSFERAVCIAREHHVYPHHIVGYGFRDHVAYSCWPAAVFIGPLLIGLCVWATPSVPVYLAVLMITQVIFLMLFGSHAHLLGHRKSDSRVLQALQRAHMLITPQYHRVHHSGKHEDRYCVINGWANVVCDRVGFWRAVEWLIQTLTGAVPRRSDHDWRRRYGRM